MQNDDRDIKIFNAKSPAEKSTEDELETMADILEKHRKNGNLAKAGKLGEELALMSVGKVVSIPYGDDINVESGDYTGIQYQASVLLVFSARYFLGRYLGEELIPTAMSALYNKLIDISPSLFKDLSGGAEISFYTLALSRDGEQMKHIGNCFAMLCKKDNDEKFSAYGAKLYGFVEKTLSKMIIDLDFKSI